MWVKVEQHRREIQHIFVIVCLDAYGKAIKIWLALKKRQMDMREPVLSTMGKMRLRMCLIRINKVRLDGNV
jgi:hypothetical protein